MKLISLLAAALIILLAIGCLRPDSYTLKGKVTNERLEGRMVYMTDALNPSVILDSARVTDGQFTFTGAQKNPEVRELMIAENDSDAFPVTLPIVLENGTIEVDLGERVYVGNTSLNNEMMEFLMAKDQFLDEESGKRPSLEQMKADFADFITQQIAERGNSPVGRYIFDSYKNKLSAEQQLQCAQITGD